MICFENGKVYTSDEAYFLGFFCADGYLGKTDKNGDYMYFGIKLALKDEGLLKKFQKEMGGTIGYSETRLKDKVYPMCNLYCGNKKVTRFLQDFGFTNKKTYKQEDYLSKIPDELHWHFIRGFFDGDGSVFKVLGEDRGGAFTLAGLNRPLLESISIKLSKVLNRNVKIKEESGFGRKIPILKIEMRGNVTVKKIAKKLYDGCGDFFLDRKKNIFDSLKITSGKNGIVGVSFHKKRGKWRAYLKGKHLGLFQKKEDAIALVEEEMLKNPDRFLKNDNGHFINCHV